jgi:outer membrane receptor protein involved in Fe transport
MMRKIVFILCGVLSAFHIEGQVVIGYGTVTGTVRDYTRSGIPDTAVVLSNEKLGFRRTLSTTDDGVFNAPAVVPGAGYSLKVSHKGFLDEDYKDFEVLVGHTLHFKISLAQDSSAKSEDRQQASVELKDVTYGLETAFSDLDVESLPARNRDVNELVPLAPGVTPESVSGQLAFHSESGTNSFTTDGILAMNTFYFRQTPVGPIISQEAVSEMQTVSAGAPAEFGQTMGGSINAVTRAGGPAMHGEAYDYFNLGAMNAPDRFAPGFSPSGSRQQFGLNAGGPTLFKNLFWFASAEDLDAHSEGLNLALNPLLTNGAGTAIQPSNCTATAAQCAAAIKFMDGQLNRVVGSSLTSLTGLARLDWRPNEFNLITLEANAMHRHSPNGTNAETVSSTADLLGYNGTYTDESRYAKAGYIATWGGNVLNEFRAGWYHDRFSDYADASLLPSTGALGINVAGTQFGANPNFPSATGEERYQLVDNWVFSDGPHSLKFGGDFSKTQDWNRQIINSAGNYIYPTLTAFAEDFSGNTAHNKDYTVMNQTFGQPVVNLNIKRMNFYAQDTWAPIRNLSLVLGFRYEKTFIPQPPYDNPPYYQTGSIDSPNINFSPRIGLVYQLGDRTVIRLGLGSYYQPFPGQLLDALYTGNATYQFPISVNPTLTGAPYFPNIVTAPKNFSLGSTDLTWAVSKFRSPVSAQGVVSIEREVSRDWTVSLNYLYNRGIELFAATDQNLNPPTLNETYAIDNAAGAVVGNYSTFVFNVKANPSVAHTSEVGNGGRSSYQGASIQARKRMSHGMTLEASYTWSHAVDNVSGTPVVAGFVPISTTPGQFGSDRGNSLFNQPNRVLLRWVYQPKFAGILMRGWQLSGTATFASSLAETPLVLVNGQQFTGVTMPYTDSLNGSGGWSRVPFQGVNSLLTGPQYNVDARLSREFPFTDRVRGRLMFEAFNAFNTQYNTSLNTVAYIATAGILRPVAGVGMGNAADGFPWGDNARHLQVALRIVF